MIRWYTRVVAARDHRAQAWWAGALGWQVFFESDDEGGPEGNEFCVLTPRAY